MDLYSLIFYLLFLLKYYNFRIFISPLFMAVSNLAWYPFLICFSNLFLSGVYNMESFVFRSIYVTLRIGLLLETHVSFAIGQRQRSLSLRTYSEYEYYIKQSSQYSGKVWTCITVTVFKMVWPFNILVKFFTGIEAISSDLLVSSTQSPLLSVSVLLINFSQRMVSLKYGPLFFKQYC